MSQSRFVILTLSDDETTCGLTVLCGAFSCGKAVIATRAAATIDHIRDGENGLLVGLGDVGDLVRKARLLLDNPELARTLGANGQRHVHQLSWESRCQRFHQMLNRVLDSD